MHHCTLVGFLPERRFRIVFFVPGLRPLKMFLHNCSRNCRISLHTVRLLQFAENKTYWPRSHTFWPYPSSGPILTQAHLTGLCSTVTGGDVFCPCRTHSTGRTDPLSLVFLFSRTIIFDRGQSCFGHPWPCL